MCLRNSFYWEAELGPNTSLPFIGSMQISKTAQRCIGVNLSVLSNSATPWTAALQASLSITNSWSLLKLMSIDSVMPFNHLILCHPLLLLLSIFPSIRVLSNESALHIRWPKYWSFSFCINPSNENSGLISFRIDWFGLLIVQRILKSLLPTPQFKNINCSVLSLRYGLTLIYMTTGKTIALTRWTFVGKVMSLLFNMLPGLAIAFLPRSKCSLISWLQSPYVPAIPFLAIQPNKAII